MEIRRRRIASGIRAIALLVVSITFTAAIAVGMLIDTLTAPTLSASTAHACLAVVHPIANTLELVDVRCVR